MLGAIIGDIVGSVYEWNNIKTKDFPLFRDDCFFTDDTVMTIATADALMKGGQPDDFIGLMKAVKTPSPKRLPLFLKARISRTPSAMQSPSAGIVIRLPQLPEALPKPHTGFLIG